MATNDRVATGDVSQMVVYAKLGPVNGDNPEQDALNGEKYLIYSILAI